MKRKSLREQVGHKKGTKRSDKHWVDPEGAVWDSRYEYLVYKGFQDAGAKVRRTTKSDTFSFTLPIRGASCASCGSAKVGQLRHYTPDIHVTPRNSKHKAECYYVEAKGFLRAKQRSLLRAFYKENPDSSVRYVLQRDYPTGAVSKRTGQRSSIIKWFNKYLPNAKVIEWKGNPPEDWI